LFDLTLTNRLPDMIEEGYDMSIVLARELPDSGLSLSGLHDLQHSLRVAGLPEQTRNARLAGCASCS
jgi:hypothetical protein